MEIVRVAASYGRRARGPLKVSGPCDLSFSTQTGPSELCYIQTPHSMNSAAYEVTYTKVGEGTLSTGIRHKLMTNKIILDLDLVIEPNVNPYSKTR